MVTSPLLQRRQSSSSEAACTICYARPRDAALQPCGHGGFCFPCGKTLVAMHSRCPLCRVAITAVLHFDPDAPVTRDAQGHELIVSDKSAGAHLA